MCDAARAKYALQHTVRTHLGCEDAAYQCMGAGQDAQGLPGVFLRKNVIETASRALAENLRVLTPLITPPAARVRRRPTKPCLLFDTDPVGGRKSYYEPRASAPTHHTAEAAC